MAHRTMCGIFGNVGTAKCSGPLVEGLDRRERRRYNSSGDERPRSEASARRDFLPVRSAAADPRPLVSMFPLQPFASSLANLKRTDANQPRELAKSVALE